MLIRCCFHLHISQNSITARTHAYSLLIYSNLEWHFIVEIGFSEEEQFNPKKKKKTYEEDAYVVQLR